jgi:hypothetical protein
MRLIACVMGRLTTRQE